MEGRGFTIVCLSLSFQAGVLGKYVKLPAKACSIKTDRVRCDN